MKKTILSLLFLFFISAINAQEQLPTSQAEYDYGSAGYKLQLQMKLPMKKGYSVTQIASVEKAERKCVFNALTRDKEKEPCAIIMVYSRPRANPEYFCIPSADAPTDLWDAFFKSLKSDVENEQERFRYFTYAIATALMKK